MLWTAEALSLQVVDTLDRVPFLFISFNALYGSYLGEGYGNSVEEDAGISFHKHQADLTVLHLADVAGVGEGQLLTIRLACLEGLRESY